MDNFITLLEWLETVNYAVTEGDTYYNDVYGSDLHAMSSWNGKHSDGGWSSCVVFKAGINQGQPPRVLQVEVCDYSRNIAYRLVDPEFRTQMYNDRNAWDDVDYIDLETVDDFLDKACDIIDGVDYDSRVSIPLDITQSEFDVIARMAHEQDITFNQMVEQILQDAIDRRSVNA